jgi:hypothetical protein
LTCVCPSVTHGLVYRVRPIMEVDQHKDSTRLTWRQRKTTLTRIQLELL